MRTPRPGSNWECQVSTHFTKVDGSLNRSGYYTELWGFPVSSSNSDVNSDSDSSNGNSSDCVIISPSSFTGKKETT
ncbi:hypothetical protein A2U01_0081634, partial [Trifolium medium]|nr:hypothetical protein [Trifolium medium]